MLWAIQVAGLNRAKIRDVIAHLPHPWPGVTGDIVFSAVLDDVGETTLARCEGGRWSYLTRAALAGAAGLHPAARPPEPRLGRREERRREAARRLQATADEVDDRHEGARAGRPAGGRSVCLSSRGTSAGRVPRDPAGAADGRIPRRPTRPKLLGMHEPYKPPSQVPLDFRGPGREEPEPDVDEVVLGWFGPGDPAHPEFGDFWRGAVLALEQENAAGGYRGKPFRLVPVVVGEPLEGRDRRPDAPRLRPRRLGGHRRRRRDDDAPGRPGRAQVPLPPAEPREHGRHGGPRERARGSSRCRRPTSGTRP